MLGPTSVSIAHQGPVELKETGEVFSEEDKMILEFLWTTYQRLPMPRRKHKHHSLASLILRAVGAYPELKLERKIGRLLLQEVGALAPWSEKSDESILIPIPGRRGAHVADHLFAVSESTAQDLGFDALPSEIPMTDTMAHLRTDWGETEVLCIDKPSALVLDDGISIEKAEGSTGTWVHVHVAHPTAYFSPDHVFAQRGRHFGVSIYTSRTSYQMLPESVGRTFSLGPNKPVFTISSLVLPTREGQDIKMSVGTIRRVNKLNPRAVDVVMGREQPEQAFMTVGKEVSTPQAAPDPEHIEAAQRHLSTLRILDELMCARLRYRARETREVPTYEHKMYDLSAWTSFLEPYDPKRLTKSYHYEGDPSIKVVADRSLSSFPGVVDRMLHDPITTHVMILASESTGRWLAERHIPAVFTGATPNPEWPIARLNTTSRHEQGLIPFARTSSIPIPHVNLMIPQYARMTSPLRRFSDMMTMWQVDSVLLRQEPRGVQLDDVSGPKNLPYTKEAIDELLAQTQSTLGEIDKLMKKSMLHWTFQALFRAFHFKEAPLPEIWDMRVEQFVTSDDPDFSQLRGNLYPFRIICDLMKSTEGWEKQSQLEDYIPVKIELVDVTKSKVYCRAVGPPSSKPTQTGPFNVVSSSSSSTPTTTP